MSSWINFLRKKKKKGLNIIEISTEELEKYPRAINQIMKEELDALILRNFLKEGEIQTLIRNYEKVPLEKQSCTGEGIYMYPEAFSSINNRIVQGESIEDTYEQTVQFWKEFPSAFEFDYIQKIKDLFLKISDVDSVDVPKDREGLIGRYHPSSFRRLMPGSGTLKLHCGRFFHENFPEFYKELYPVSDIHHQLSHFVTLQEAEQGGDLILYTTKWEDAPKKIGEMILESTSGETIDLGKNFKDQSVQLKLGAGDLLIFKGSNIWHQVTEVKGNKPRYTLGSFVSKAKDNNQLHIWA